jgi:DNA-binding response OmpR family regulator
MYKAELAPGVGTDRAGEEKVLIVEDSAYLGAAIAQVVGEMGYQAEVVGTGEAALEALASAVPDLVVLDWVLPGIQGIEVLRAIRSGPLSALAVIMLTARGELASRLEGLEAGADDYIAKPVHLDELKARISAVMRRTG